VRARVVRVNEELREDNVHKLEEEKEEKLGGGQGVVAHEVQNEVTAPENLNRVHALK
jgi:hypothetical protein